MRIRIRIRCTGLKCYFNYGLTLFVHHQLDGHLLPVALTTKISCCKMHTDCFKFSNKTKQGY